jgi:DNA-binding transcriptional MerR regulator
MKFAIETVSKMTGIPAPSLRNWEKRYGFPNPERTPGGHRFYSAADVEFLKKAVQQIEEGQSLTELAKLYREEVIEVEAPQTSVKAEIIDDVTYRVQLIYKALLNFDQLATLQHYATLSAKLSVEQLFDRVFEIILKRIDQDLSTGKISNAQEHFASAFVRLKLSTFLSLDFPPTQSPRILAATLTEERCEGSLMLIVAHLKFRGYPVFYFGTNLPLEDLKSVTREVKADVICLSYGQIEALLRDSRYLSQFKIPVCLSGAAVFDPELKLKAHKPLYFCQKMIGSEASQYVEMLCQSKSSLK